MIEFLGLCTNQQVLDGYNAATFTFDSEDEYTSLRAKRVCIDCPRQLNCFNDAVNFIRKNEKATKENIEIQGVWAGYTTGEIYDLTFGKKRIGRQAILAELAERQAEKQKIWLELENAT